MIPDKPKTTDADAAETVALFGFLSTITICATVIWILAYWTPRAAQWWDRHDCQETATAKKGTAWESLVESDKRKFPEKWEKP